MQRFESILVVIDERTDNRAVVERAVILARRNHARLTIANAVRGIGREEPSAPAPEPPAPALESGPVLPHQFSGPRRVHLFCNQVMPLKPYLSRENRLTAYYIQSENEALNQPTCGLQPHMNAQ